MKTKLFRSQLVRSRLCIFTLLTLITLISCEKSELHNELVGTKWEQVDRYSSRGWFKKYDDKGNWYTIPYTDTEKSTTELIFIDNNIGSIRMKRVKETTYYDESKHDNVTNEEVFYDVTSEFRYSFDSNKRKGRISYVIDFKGTAMTGMYDKINADYDFGLFYDSDDLWLNEKDNVFTKSK